MKDKIIAHFKTEYQSSPTILDEDEINLLIENDCSCEHCGKSIFELDDHPSIDTDKKEVLCEHCYIEQYMNTCPICEDYYYKALRAEDEVIIISKESVIEYGMEVKPGFYQVKKWPYYLANCVSGFDALFNDAIEMIRECDINSMLHKLYPRNGKEKVSAGECCHDCMKRYTGQVPIENNYVDKKYGKKRVEFERQVIQEGK